MIEAKQKKYGLLRDLVVLGMWRLHPCPMGNVSIFHYPYHYKTYLMTLQSQKNVDKKYKQKNLDQKN